MLAVVVLPRGLAAQAPTAWRIADAPIVSVGANDEFASITSGAFFGDGSFVIGDARSYRVSVFDAAGRVQRTIGRSGSGPGEFRNLAWALPYRADSIATYDRAQRRLTVFSRAGIPARSVILGSPGEGWAPEALALLDDGRIVVRTTRSIGGEQAAPGIHAAAMAVWIYSPAGAPAARIAGDLVGEEWVRLATPSLLMGRPFATVSLVASRDARIFVADSADAPIRVLAATGEELRRIGARATTRVTSSAHVAAYRESRLVEARQSSGADAVATQSRILDAIPFPPRVPPLRRLMVDRDGRLWAEEYPAPRAPRQRFRVYAPDGRLLAHAVGPERGRVLDAHGDRVLVAWSDADGAPHVRVHRFTPEP